MFFTPKTFFHAKMFLRQNFLRQNSFTPKLFYAQINYQKLITKNNFRGNSGIPVLVVFFRNFDKKLQNVSIRDLSIIIIDNYDRINYGVKK